MHSLGRAFDVGVALFVIGGYISSHLGVDSLVLGFYRGQDLIYAARVRAGLVPSTRRDARFLSGLST